jgi:DNA segregation ATPase FtsK/SpoIIIE-like protein
VLEVEQQRKHAIAELSQLLMNGLTGVLAYIGLKPLLDGNPTEFHNTEMGHFITQEAFPIMDEISWPFVGFAVCIGALGWQISKRIPKHVGVPKFVPDSWVVPIGKTYRGKWVYFDFSGEIPHCIFCGSTKFGKTAFLKLVLYVLCNQITPDKMKVLIIDLKGGASFADWLNVPHVLDVKYTPEDAEKALEEAEGVMWNRLEQIREAKFKRKPVPTFPHLLVVIDEGMVLSESEKAMKHLLRIASIGRESHVHLCYGTQRPSHEILPVTTRDQLEGRFVFHLNERSSSEVVLGHSLAYDMKRQPGLMIHRAANGDVKLQTAYVDNETLDAWTGSFVQDETEAETEADDVDKAEMAGGNVIPLSSYRETEDWGD